MRLRLKTWLAGGMLVAVCSAACAETPEVAALLKPLHLVGYRTGTVPPPFSGRTLDARQLATDALRGRVVIVNFWASWCAECRPEMPDFEWLHRKFGARGLSIIGINAREKNPEVARFAKTLGLSFPLVLDPDGKINAQYGVVGLPATFVIARDGRAVAFAIGTRQWRSAPAIALIESLLAEPAAGAAP